MTQLGFKTKREKRSENEEEEEDDDGKRVDGVGENQ